MSLGEKISSLRRSKGISQELLAENARISLRTIQRIESGATVPRPYTLKVISEALGIPVDELAVEAVDHELEQKDDDLATLRLINLSALAGFILPLSNILLPLVIWRKNRGLPLVNGYGKKVISFQILWTLGTFLAAILTLSITRSVSIGRLPPTAFLVYVFFLMINLVFILRSAVQLNKRGTPIYSFVPSLF